VKNLDVKIVSIKVFTCFVLCSFQAVALADKLTFECAINYDQAAAEKEISSLLTSLKVDIQGNLASMKGTSNGASYTLTPKTVEITGDMKVTAPVVEIDKDDPCGDAIDLSLTIPKLVVTGTWSISYLGMGHTGTFSDTITDLTIKGLAKLARLNVATAKAGVSYNRNVSQVVANGYNVGSNNFVIDGGSGMIGSILTSLTNLMKTKIMDSIYKSASGKVISDPKLTALPAPVTVKVLTTP